MKNTQESLPPFGWDTEPGIGTELVAEGASVGVFCDLMYSGGWMEIEREEIDGALVGAIVKALRYQRLNVICFADRVQTTGTSINRVDYFRQCRPTHSLCSVPFRRVCAARTPPTIIRGRTKQKNIDLPLITWQDKAMEANCSSKWTVLRCRTRPSESEFSGG